MTELVRPRHRVRVVRTVVEMVLVAMVTCAQARNTTA